jgi:hypothetical protein
MVNAYHVQMVMAASRHGHVYLCAVSCEVQSARE